MNGQHPRGGATPRERLTVLEIHHRYLERDLVAARREQAEQRREFLARLAAHKRKTEQRWGRVLNAVILLATSLMATLGTIVLTALGLV